MLGVEEDLHQAGVGALVREGAEGGVDGRLGGGGGGRAAAGAGAPRCRGAGSGGGARVLPVAGAHQGPGALGEAVEAPQLPVGAQALQAGLLAGGGGQGAVVLPRGGRAGEGGQVAEGGYPFRQEEAGLGRGDVGHQGQALGPVALVQAVGIEEAAVALEGEGEGGLLEGLGGDAGHGGRARRSARRTARRPAVPGGGRGPGRRARGRTAGARQGLPGPPAGVVRAPGAGGLGPGSAEAGCRKSPPVSRCSTAPCTVSRGIPAWPAIWRRRRT